LRERIALAFGIPVTREEFLARASDSSWDYGRKLRVSRGATDVFERVYAPICTIAADVASAVEEFGIHVYRGLTLRGLAEISRQYDAIVLVAHWRGSSLSVDDLLTGWVEHLLDGLHPPPQAEVAAALTRVDLPFGAMLSRERRDTAELRTLAIDTFNRLLRSDYFVRWLPGGIGTQLETANTLREALSRDLLDEVLGEHVRPGNQLELTDGLHDVASVHAALDADFAGTLDLSCCTSSVLGTYLQIVREGLDVIMGDPLILPGPQLRLIQSAVEVTAKEDCLTYAVARRAVSRELSELRPENDAW
jgi:hypothetical protein